MVLMQDAKTKNVEHVLILSGDHLYRMDYMNFVQVSFMLLCLFVNTELHVTFMLISCRSTLSQMLTSQFLVFPWMRGVSENHSLTLFLPYFWLMNFSVFLFFLHHSRASDFGLLKIDKSGQIVQFSEKPKGDHLKAMVSNQFSFVYQSFKTFITKF